MRRVVALIVLVVFAAGLVVAPDAAARPTNRARIHRLEQRTATLERTLRHVAAALAAAEARELALRDTLTCFYALPAATPTGGQLNPGGVFAFAAAVPVSYWIAAVDQRTESGRPCLATENPSMSLTPALVVP